MNTLIAGFATTGFIVAAGLGLAGAASASVGDLVGGPADNAVQTLQAQGYTVQINGDQNAPLSECIVTDISGLSGTNSAGKAVVPKGSTVYVGVSCNDDHDE